MQPSTDAALSTASGQAPEDRRGEPLLYSHAGLELRGELYRPGNAGNGRAVIVLHEADGIGANVRRHSAMLADDGYVVLAADMHGGGRVLDGDAMRDAVDRFRQDPDLVRDRVAAAVDALGLASGIGTGMTAAIGYCFGGFTVLELARSGAALRAVASFHGLLTTARPAAKGAVAARVAVYTGALDPLVPPQDVASFQQEMMEAGADWQMSIYGKALHSFTNRTVDRLGDPRMAYDAEADRASWADMLRFLDESFKEPSPGPA